MGAVMIVLACYVAVASRPPVVEAALRSIVPLELDVLAIVTINPLAMTAGIETLKILSKKNTYKKLEEKAALLEAGLIDAAKRAGVKTRFYRAGTMFCTYFTDTHVVDYQTA